MESNKKKKNESEEEKPSSTIPMEEDEVEDLPEDTPKEGELKDASEKAGEEEEVEIEVDEEKPKESEPESSEKEEPKKDDDTSWEEKAKAAGWGKKPDGATATEVTDKPKEPEPFDFGKRLQENLVKAAEEGKDYTHALVQTIQEKDAHAAVENNRIMRPFRKAQYTEQFKEIGIEEGLVDSFMDVMEKLDPSGTHDGEVVALGLAVTLGKKQLEKLRDAATGKKPSISKENIEEADKSSENLHSSTGDRNKPVFKGKTVTLSKEDAAFVRKLEAKEGKKLTRQQIQELYEEGVIGG